MSSNNERACANVEQMHNGVHTIWCNKCIGNERHTRMMRSTRCCVRENHEASFASSSAYYVTHLLTRH